MKLFYVTFPDDTTREEIANNVVDDRLAGCIVATSVDSLYIWNDEKQEDNEVAALFKTSEARADELVSRIAEQHPHDVPCIIEIPAASTKDYDLWLHDVTKGVIDYSDGADETVLVRFDAGPIFQVAADLTISEAAARIQTPDVSNDLAGILRDILHLRETISPDEDVEPLSANGQPISLYTPLTDFTEEPVHLRLP